MRVFQSLQHLQLIVNHFLISLDILFENDLDGDLLSILRFCLADNAICTCAERASKLVQSPVERMS